MKIRVKENTLRLRLSQTDLKRLEREGAVKSSIRFAGGVLTYSLRKTAETQLTADFTDGHIEVKVPEATADRWITSDQVGFDATLQYPDHDLYILVEKDFKCSIDRGEDESDLFEPVIK